MLRVKKLLNFLIAMSKRCTKCGEVKDLSAFNKQKRGLYGFRSSCKSCELQYYKDNKERIDIYSKHYTKNNREKINTRRRQYRKDNYEKIIIIDRLYCLNNKERMSTRNQQYKKDNKEKIKEYNTYRCNNLHDGYVISQISQDSSLTPEDIKKYPMLIETKRNNLKIKRLIKQLSK